MVERILLSSSFWKISLQTKKKKIKDIENWSQYFCLINSLPLQYHPLRLDEFLTVCCGCADPEDIGVTTTESKMLSTISSCFLLPVWERFPLGWRNFGCNEFTFLSSRFQHQTLSQPKVGGCNVWVQRSTLEQGQEKWRGFVFVLMQFNTNYCPWCCCCCCFSQWLHWRRRWWWWEKGESLHLACWPLNQVGVGVVGGLPVKAMQGFDNSICL